MEDELTFGERAKYISDRLKEIDDVNKKVVFEVPDGKGGFDSVFILHRSAITDDELVKIGREIGCIG